MRLPPDIRDYWARTLRAARGILAFITAAALAVLLGFLYQKTQGADSKRQHAVLGYFRELKEMDARWDVEALRARAELASPPPAVFDHGAMLDRILRELSAAARDLDSPVLDGGLANLNQAFSEKAGLMAEFGSASTAAGQALQQVMGADNEIAGLIRGAWRDYPQRERLIAMENVFSQLISSAQKYYFSPTDIQRQHLETVAADLRDAAAPLPEAVRNGVSRLEGNVQQLLTAKPVEQRLFNRLFFLTAGSRVGSLANAFNRELEEALAERELYRVYLIAYSGALLILIGYLAALLIAAWWRIKQENFTLQAENEEPAKRLVEGAQGPPEAPRQP